MNVVARLGAAVSAALIVGAVQASWYWPFGSDEGGKTDAPRISELMEPVSQLIDEASDLSVDGKSDEAVEKYRKALEELDRIEMENPERVKSSEFATLRNKRAYVNAAIDSLLLGQVRANAKAVAVSDTTELEKRLAAEKAEKAKARDEKGKKPAEKKPAVRKQAAAKPATEKTAGTPRPQVPQTRREQAMDCMTRGDYVTAANIIDSLLAERPNGAAALNLRAVLEARQGHFKEAEATLDQAIMSNPRNHYAYYNMANLLLQVDPSRKSVAKRYYETGRAVGGPVNESLEAALR